MALQSTGLPHGGVTTFYKFLYDSSLAGAGGIEPARTTQLMADCDADFRAHAGMVFRGDISVFDPDGSGR